MKKKQCMRITKKHATSILIATISCLFVISSIRIFYHFLTGTESFVSMLTSCSVSIYSGMSDPSCLSKMPFILPDVLEIVV